MDMHGYIYIYLDMIYMVITLPKAGYDIENKLLTVVDTTHSRDLSYIFSNFNGLNSDSFLVT